MKKLTEYRYFRHVLFFAVGVALLALDHKTWSRFVQELTLLDVSEPVWSLLRGIGEAIIIAVVLVVAFDEATKRRFLEGVIKDASGHLLGSLLPPKLSQHITTQFLRTELVRKDWTIEYTISEWEGQRDYIKLEMLSTYTMENHSAFPQDYTCYYEVEQSLLPDMDKATIEEVSGHNPANPHERFSYLSKDSRYQDGKVCTLPGKITFRHDVKIPGHKQPSDPLPSYSFKVRSVECFYKASIVPFFAKHPVLSTTLIVQYSENKMDVFVDLSFDAIEKYPPRPAPPHGKEWNLDQKPMLSGQGFTVRFAPKS